MALRDVYNVTVKSARDSALNPDQTAKLGQCFQRSVTDVGALGVMVIPVYQSREGVCEIEAKKLVGFQVASVDQAEANDIADTLSMHIFKNLPVQREEKVTQVNDEDLFAPAQRHLNL